MQQPVLKKQVPNKFLNQKKYLIPALTTKWRGRYEERSEWGTV